MQIASAGFAPVKGTRHTPYDVVHLDEHGPVGDRALCLVDVERAHVLRTVQHPLLVAVRTRWDGHTLSVVLPSEEVSESAPRPDGRTVRCEYWGRPVDLELLDGPHAELFSGYLGRAVRLAAAPPGGVVYAGAVSLVTTGSLRALADRVGDSRLVAEAARFRATVVVEADEAFAEDCWVGCEVDLGSARIRITSPIPRCAVIDSHPVTGVRDLRVLDALADLRRESGSGGVDLGVDAEVVVPGDVRPGDEVRLVT